jgi:hypothetical protein
METTQDIPHFLEEFRPGEDRVTFDDDTDNEDDVGDKKDSDDDKAAFSGDDSKPDSADENRQSRWAPQETKKKEEVEPDW